MKYLFGLFLLNLTLFCQLVGAKTSQRYLITSPTLAHYQNLKITLSSHTKKQSLIQKSISLDQLNTFVVDSAASLDELRNMYESAVIEKDYTFSPPQGHQASVKFGTKNLWPNIAIPGSSTWNLQMIKAPQAWALGFSGETTRVMLLDTGIDKNHPSIKDNFEKGQDFAGGANPNYAYFDSVGHGTHTSGIVAGTLSPMGSIGVAPKAQLLMGRVCSSQSCSASAVLQGLNWALAEKVDVVSLSLSKPQTSQAESNAVKKLEEANIVVVASSGNDGKANVLYPAALPTVIAVGSMNEDLSKSVFSNWGAELDFVAPGANIFSASPQGKGAITTVLVDGQSVMSATFVGAPLTATPFTSDLINCGNGRPADFPAEVNGKTAFIKRGEIKFIEKLNTALKVGAKAVIFYNNEAGLVEGDLHGQVKIPVALIQQSDGEKISQALLSGKKMTSEISNQVSDYKFDSGTSMATPHVTGVVALIKSKNKSLTPAQVRAILSQAAHQLPEGPENYFGAGFVDAEKSILATP
jgi:subtilisin family serine protease